ncbi:hypothetical protein D3C78_1294800 [compost metagenome]
MDPGGRDHRADALCDHGDVRFVDLMRRADVIAEGLHIPRTGGKARAVAPFARRLAMAARVPGKEVEPGQVQFIHQVRNAPGVFMTTMKQQHSLTGLTRRRVDSRPVPVEQLYAVKGSERQFLGFAHCKFLYAEGAFSFTWPRP